jgi:MGT family glycosyltransferase
MPYKFLVATMPVPGHVAPFAPLVRELLKRGHEVVWYGSRHFQKSIEATGARFTPLKTGVDFGDSQYNRHFPERAKYSGLKQVVFEFEKLFVESIPGMVKDLTEVMEQYRPDVLLGDPAVVATRVLSETRDIPAAVLNITVLNFESPELPAFGLGLPHDTSLFGRLRNRLSYKLVDHIVFRPVNRAFAAMSRKNGWIIRPFRSSIPPHLQLQPMVPSFEFPVSEMPRQLHFVGVLLPDAPPDFTPPAWWERVLKSGKPIVLVTQGTVATNVDELIRPTLEALKDEDVWVVATTGGKPAAELGFPIPANAVVEPFIPFATIMPHINAYVTNGGYGGICIALAAGVPVISAGTTEDKMEVGNRVSHSGVGINLKTNRPTTEQVRTAVRKLLSQPSYSERARSIQSELAQHDAPNESATLLEELARTRQPVLRPL